MKVIGGLFSTLFAAIFSGFATVEPSRPYHGFPFLFIAVLSFSALLTARNIQIPASLAMVGSEEKTESLLDSGY